MQYLLQWSTADGRGGESDEESREALIEAFHLRVRSGVSEALACVIGDDLEGWQDEVLLIHPPQYDD